ncbi:hypothetical protein R1flu_004670 [Riccia fluitans]|uniref:Reverse transcriptase n=1 Tax=Riccia fluitans TaxID=41844 RepID=A0ABD1YQZ0_9MARC
MAALRKLNSQILQWKNFYLPWAARVVLIKHVLAQIPSFVMMAVGCSVKDAKRLEQYCRQFLWGVNEQGILKKPLIAWRKMARPKEQGGLGLMDFKDQSDALQMRYMTAILDGRNVE